MLEQPAFDDLPILGELGASLRAAMAQAEAAPAVSAPPVRRRRRPRFGWLTSLLVIGLVGTAAAAGTLTLLRGSPIPGPKAEDTQPSMTPRLDSLRVLDLRANDPAGGGALPFALRTGESESGQVCASVGQVDGSDFGIVGEDGRFRTLPKDFVDSCGSPTDDDAAVAGARVLDAKRYDDVRTVVYGAGAKDLKSAAVVARGTTTPLKVEDGAFVGVVKNYPEDVGLQLRMRIGDHTVVRSFGTGPMLLLDPTGPAWQLSRGGSGNASGFQTDCVSVVQVRPRSGSSRRASTPLACYRSRVRKRHLPKMPVPVIYDARALHQGDRSTPKADDFATWSWPAPARTVLWGMVDHARVRRVELITPTGTQRLRITTNFSFGAVLPASVPARELRLRVTMRDGSSRTYSRPVVPTTSMRP